MVTHHIAVKSRPLKISSYIHSGLQTPAVLSLLLMTIRASSLGIKFISTLYIARFLGLEALGLYGLITAASIVIPNIIGLGIGYTVCRRAVTATPEELVIDLKYYLRFFCICYFLVIAGAVVFGSYQDNLFFCVAVILIICFEHLNGSSYQLQQNLSMPISANILHFIRSSLWVIAFIAISFFYEPGRNIETLLVLWILGSAFSFACFIWLIKDWPWQKPLPQESTIFWVINEFKISHKAYFSGLTEAISMYQDRYLFGFFLGLELTGVFVFYWQLTSALGNLLYTGIAQVMRPEMVRSYKNKDSNFEKIYKKCLLLSLVGGTSASLVSIIVLKSILPFLQKPMVEEYFYIYYIMVLTFNISIVREIQKIWFYSQHRDDLILNVNLITLIGSTILILVFISLAGLWGACLSVLIMTACSVAIQTYYKIKLKAAHIQSAH